MEKWLDYYFLCGSAAAGLTGLMFISLTFGSQFVKRDNMEMVDLFFGTISYHFIHAFFLCAVASAPTANIYVLGSATFGTGLWRLIRLVRSTVTMKKAAEKDREVEMSDWALNIVFPGLVYCTLLAAGFAFYYNHPSAVNLLAISVLAMLLIGMRSAWDMLVWVASKTDEKIP